MVFVDGLGIGPADAAVNPLCRFSPRILRFTQESLGPFPHGGHCIATDARLSVDGLPQSGTGQTTLFTGINAAQYINQHLPGFPDRRLRELIGRESLFRKVKLKGRSVTFANTYTDRFFQQRPRWISVTTVMCEKAGVPLRRIEDLRNGRGLFFDYSNARLAGLGLDVPRQTPEQAASVLLNINADYDLCLYEYFLTDLVGHRGTMEDAVEISANLDRFLNELVERLDFGRTSLILCSDHGNLEDMTTGLHTLNPVPTTVWGSIRELFPSSARRFSLEEITPLLVRFLSAGD